MKRESGKRAKPSLSSAKDSDSSSLSDVSSIHSIITINPQPQQPLSESNSVIHKSKSLDSEVQETESKLKLKRQALFRHDGQLSNLCLNNGVSETDFIDNIDKITFLEMCHFNFKTISGLQGFGRHLSKLSIVAQDITDIEGLEDCVSLTELWICETRVSKIKSIDHLKQLKRLFLYANRIRKIEGLEGLKHLEVLWLSDNEIEKLENLDNLSNLHQLHIGNNLISEIGNAFNNNLLLTDILLSGNMFSSFREILHLARLPKLESLSMSDPNFRENPIAQLCNYQTHVILHLPKLKYLDTLEISEESRKIIGATVLKKRMYYNMRIRTIRRNENFGLGVVRKLYVESQHRLEADVRVLWALSKRIKRRQDDLLLNSGNQIQNGKDSHQITSLNEPRLKVRELLDIKQEMLNQIRQRHLRLSGLITEQSDLAIRKLLLELETGGNVRFEEDQDHDSWLPSFEDVIGSFVEKGSRETPLSSVRINRVSKIHNRHLKAVFENKIFSAIDVGEQPTYTHLVFQVDEDSEKNLFQIIEFGFSKYFDSTNKLMLQNFINCLDRKNNPSVRYAIVVKVWAPKVARVANLEAMINYKQKGSDQDFSGICTEFASLLELDSESNAIGGAVNCSSSDPCQMYHSFDSDFIIPDFFVEYSLDNANDEVLKKLSVLSEETLSVEKTIVNNIVVYHLAQPNFPLLMMESIPSSATPKNEAEIPYTLDAQLQELIKYLSKYPELKNNDFPSPAFTMGMLLRTPLPLVESLNLSYTRSPSGSNKGEDNAQSKSKQADESLPRSITYLENFTCLINLKTLILCNVELSQEKSLLVLSKFPLLETLDLSFNQLKTIPRVISSLSNLKSLDLSVNLLDNFEDFLFLIDCARQICLGSLDLRFNPICIRKQYKQFLINRLTSLEHLNDEDVTERVQSNFSHDTCGKQSQLLQHSSSCQPYIFRPLSVRTRSGNGSTTSLSEYWDVHYNIEREQSENKSGVISQMQFGLKLFLPEVMTCLELDNCNLFDLDILPASLTNLRWISLRSNSLKNVDRLAMFKSLEEICVEGNEIDEVEQLCNLPALLRLDANDNLISGIHSASEFKSLIFLSLDRNRVKSLKSFSTCKTLMELYIGNNYIKELHSIFPLKDLQRLIILDMNGNEICSSKDYRLFMIFHLARLKILDGASIVAKEQAQAKDAFFGKLTVELLGEKIGHFCFRNIAELDLRNCKIREIDCFKTAFQNSRGRNSFAEFRNLRKLNLDNNLLTNIDSLIYIKSLKYLSLNNNKIERLLSTDVPLSKSESDGNLADTFSKFFLFPQLEELHVGNNIITRIADLGLYRMPLLRFIHLQGNRISRIDGLENMTNLIGIVLDRNNIKYAEPPSFLSLINLRELHLRENRIRSLSHFDCLPNLTRLYLQTNRIQDMIEIEKIKLPCLQEISLAGNAVSRKQIYRLTMITRCPNMCVIDGKDVSEEERQRAEQMNQEQQNPRDDPVPSIKSSSPVLINSVAGPLTKLPIKISSVVLDGMEMKLSSGMNAGIGFSRN